MARVSPKSVLQALSAVEADLLRIAEGATGTPERDAAQSALARVRDLAGRMAGPKPPTEIPTVTPGGTPLGLSLTCPACQAPTDTLRCRACKTRSAAGDGTMYDLRGFKSAGDMMSIGYHAASKTMAIFWQGNGGILYTYRDVPEQHFLEIARAARKDRAFDRLVRHENAYRKVYGHDIQGDGDFPWWRTLWGDDDANIMYPPGSDAWEAHRNRLDLKRRTEAKTGEKTLHGVRLGKDRDGAVTIGGVRLQVTYGRYGNTFAGHTRVENWYFPRKTKQELEEIGLAYDPDTFPYTHEEKRALPEAEPSRKSKTTTAFYTNVLLFQKRKYVGFSIRHEPKSKGPMQNTIAVAEAIAARLPFPEQWVLYLHEDDLPETHGEILFTVPFEHVLSLGMTVNDAFALLAEAVFPKHLRTPDKPRR